MHKDIHLTNNICLDIKDIYNNQNKSKKIGVIDW